MLGSSASGMSIDLKMALADQFDSVSDFSSAVDSYFETYYTKEEQAAARTAQFATVFDSLGLAMPGTLAAFRQLVDAQDLTTSAGQATYATLLQLAPAFADLQSALNGAKSAADILSERQDLEKQLLELQGNTAAIREMELANLDESNRALQQQIWALQDAQEAADAAQKLKDAWSSVGDSIMDEVNRIRVITDGTGTGSFATLQGQFNAAVAAAKGGDQDAAGTLPSLSQALIQAAELAATSRQELDRVKAQTAASLESVYASVLALAGGTSSTGVATGTSAPTGTILEAAATAAQASATSSDNDSVIAELKALREEVAQMRSDNNSGHAANAANTGAIKRKFEDRWQCHHRDGARRMKVITDAGAIEIGTTEAAPTIGLTDYSRRETDDFGVTTVVKRNFSRTMSVRVMVPTANVDALQRQLAALRAKPVQWVADDRFDSLSITGFYKDLSIDLAIPPVSYCTLTIEGLAEGADYADPGTDPATDQRKSTLRLLRPASIDDA
ncbi:hypothetical protein LTR94_026360, partial [Friedmanniomyces endolithicus]